LGSRVSVGRGVILEEAVAFDDVVIEGGARIRRAILDEGVVVPAEDVIGYDLDRDRSRFTVTDAGVVVVTKDALRVTRSPGPVTAVSTPVEADPSLGGPTRLPEDVVAVRNGAWTTKTFSICASRSATTECS